MKGSFFGTLPAAATDAAKSFDTLYIFLTVLSIFFTVLVVGGMIYFAWIYRKREGHKSSYIAHNTPLEILWTVIPTIIVLGIFVWGWVVYKELVIPPGNAYEVKVLGKQWSWQFIYEDGRVYTNKLFVPVNKPVKLIMTSEDVLHSFFIPNFRVKSDVVPGMYTSVWFEAKVPGAHQVYCAEYCGTSHSAMLAKLYALTEAEWTEFQKGKEIQVPEEPVTLVAAAAGGGANLVEQGKKLYETRVCNTCHSIDGTARVGPTFKGVWGKTEEMMDGTKVTVDENYVRESIENPNGKIVKGFAPAMPTYKGQLTEMELNALIAFIKSLK